MVTFLLKSPAHTLLPTYKYRSETVLNQYSTVISFHHICLHSKISNKPMKKIKTLNII